MTGDFTMVSKLWFLIPEILLFVAAVAVTVLGLSPSRRVRDAVPLVVCIAFAFAMVITPGLYTEARLAETDLLMPQLGLYVKVLACAMGIFLTLLSVRLVDRRLEEAMATGRAVFDPLRVNRGEFYAFLMLSMIGVMLCASASDLIWLFLALELTSLPTYVMVAMSRGSRKAQEAAMKYFFLGAMSAALFLYGFALLYGSTGTVILSEMAAAFSAQVADHGSVNAMGIVGMILVVLGLAFKLAAAPMHFYAADVYEGAASPVTALLAFAPKAAGMIGLVFVLSTVGWSGHYDYGLPGLPQPVLIVLWMLAVLTMTLGNIGALLQTSAKRVFAYSSIAHSGYMLIGVIAGPGIGLSAVMFYLLTYAVMNTAAFGVLSALERRGEEIESMSDLAGMRHKHPYMAAVMAISAGSLIGLPPLLGFWGKLYLLIAGVEAGHVPLVMIALLNSAISAYYYLKLAGLPLLAEPTPQTEAIERRPTPWPRVATIVLGVGVLVLPVFVAPLSKATDRATEMTPVRLSREPDGADEHAAAGTVTAASPDRSGSR